MEHLPTPDDDYDDDGYYYEEEVIDEVVEDEYYDDYYVNYEEEEEVLVEEENDTMEEDAVVVVAAAVVAAAAAVVEEQETKDTGRIELSDTAPSVNYNLLVVENNGLELGYDDEYGRATIANRDFRRMGSRQGDTNDTNRHDNPQTESDWFLQPILRERPAILCTSNDYLEYMECFLDRPPDIQVGVLDMYYQPVESTSMGRSLLEPARVLYLLGVLEDFHVLHQLLSIYMTNAHQFRDTHSAMMILGSKFPHSCHPTIGYSSFSDPAAAAAAVAVAVAAAVQVSSPKDNNDNGDSPKIHYNIDEVYVSYFVLRPIRAGQVLTTSYIADLFETPTPERRVLLQQTKSFWCQCKRCQGPDYCRVLPCPNCSQPIPCHYQQVIEGKGGGGDGPSTSTSTSSPHSTTTLPPYKHQAYWSCPSCDTLADTDAMQSCERGFAATLAVLERNIQRKTALLTTSKEVTRSIVLELIQECQQAMSYTHHLTIKALRLLVNLCTSRAYLQIKRYVARGQVPPVVGTTLNPMPGVASVVEGASSSSSSSFADYKHDEILCPNFWYSVWAGFQLVLACECVAANCTGCAPLLLGPAAHLPFPTRHTPPTTQPKGNHQSDQLPSQKVEHHVSDISVVQGESQTASSSAVSSYYFPHAPLYDRATPMRHVCDNLLQLPVAWWPPYAVAMTQRYLPLMRAKFGSVYVQEFDTGIVQPFLSGRVICYVCGTTHSPAPWRNTTTSYCRENNKNNSDNSNNNDNNYSNNESNSNSSSSSTKDQYKGGQNTSTGQKTQGANKLQNKKQQQNKRAGTNKKKKNRREII
jgi:hypothetical protein